MPAALLPPQQQGCRKVLTRSDHEVKGKGKVTGSQKRVFPEEISNDVPILFFFTL